MLLLAAIIWGFAFVAQSEGMNYVGPLTFNAVRYIIGAVVLIPFIFIEKNKRAAMRKENPECKGYTKKIIFAGTGSAPAFNKSTIFLASSYSKPLSPPEI